MGVQDSVAALYKLALHLIYKERQLAEQRPPEPEPTHFELEGEDSHANSEEEENKRSFDFEESEWAVEAGQLALRAARLFYPPAMHLIGPDPLLLNPVLFLPPPTMRFFHGSRNLC